MRAIDKARVWLAALGKKRAEQGLRPILLVLSSVLLAASSALGVFGICGEDAASRLSIRRIYMRCVPETSGAAW
jgi:hypothetical protein